jgi:hypothetical protein
MKIDYDKKWLSIYGYTPKGEGQAFFAVQVFRRHWEFGLDCDWHEVGTEMARSRYYLYAQKFRGKDLRVAKQWEFPRKNRWVHVTG